VALSFRKQWEINGLKPISHRDLDDPQQTFFAEALDKFSRKSGVKAERVRRRVMILPC